MRHPCGAEPAGHLEVKQQQRNSLGVRACIHWHLKIGAVRRVSSPRTPEACPGLPISYSTYATLRPRSCQPGRWLNRRADSRGLSDRRFAGRHRAVLENQYYPTHEAYLSALAEAMKEEYDAIVGAGFLLQLDCPDLGVSRVRGEDWREDYRVLHIKALNQAVPTRCATRCNLYNRHKNMPP